MNTKTTRITEEQIDEQLRYCGRIQALWMERGITPKAYVETYGCQQNEADSEQLRGMLSEAGYAIADEAEGADVVIMNTCAIREHAEQRVFGNLGALTHTKRRHPEQNAAAWQASPRWWKSSARAIPTWTVCFPLITCGSSPAFSGRC